MDRRSFSKSIVSGLALTASGLSLNTLAAVLGVEDGESECFSCDGFRRFVGHKYELASNLHGQLELTRIESASKTNPNDQFYLLFKRSEGLEMDEGIYKLVSPHGKPLTLMLSPSSTSPELMEAVINLQNFA